MNREHAWVRWWALAWATAHADWHVPALRAIAPESLNALTRHCHPLLGRTFAIEPCLPIEPHPALLQWVLADTQQQALILMLLEAMCQPIADSRLSTDQNLWCERVAKALRPGQWLKPTDDPLQLLRAWVTPQTWQRMRLRFPRPRITEIERLAPYTIARSKLEALWQALIWHVIEEAAPPTLETPADAFTTHA